MFFLFSFVILLLFLLDLIVIIIIDDYVLLSRSWRISLVTSIQANCHMIKLVRYVLTTQEAVWQGEELLSFHGGCTIQY